MLHLVVTNCAGVLSFVSKKILEVTFLEEFSYLKSKCNAVGSGMSMVSMELTPFGDVPLWIWIGRFARPSDGVAHVFHDGNYLYWFYVKIVL